MKILVPVDGSKYSMEGVNIALDYAKTKGAEIFLVNVVPFIPGIDLEISASKWDHLMEDMKKIGEEALNKASSVLKSQGISSHTVLSTSADVAEEIVSLAEKEKIDLVIIGSRGYTGAERFMLGSAASKVVIHSPCSVYVVKKV
jgi:nucleotide-binding universal stress UspA family protein